MPDQRSPDDFMASPEGLATLPKPAQGGGGRSPDEFMASPEGLATLPKPPAPAANAATPDVVSSVGKPTKTPQGTSTPYVTQSYNDLIQQPGKQMERSALSKLPEDLIPSPTASNFAKFSNNDLSPEQSDALGKLEAQRAKQKLVGAVNPTTRELDNSWTSANKMRDAGYPMASTIASFTGQDPNEPAPGWTDAFNPGRGIQGITQGVEQIAEPGTGDKARGTGKVALGAMQFASPLVTSSGITTAARGIVPAAKLAAWMAGGEAAGYGARKAAEKAGLSPEDAAEIGNLTTFLPMVFGVSKGTLEALAEQRGKVRAEVAQKFQERGDELAPARAYANAASEPVDVIVRTGTGKTVGTGILGQGAPEGQEQTWAPAQIRFAGQFEDPKTGKLTLGYKVVTQAGKKIYDGTGPMVSEWLASRVRDPDMLTKWQQSAGIGEPSTAQVQTRAQHQILLEQETNAAGQSNIVNPSDVAQAGGATLSPVEQEFIQRTLERMSDFAHGKGEPLRVGGKEYAQFGKDLRRVVEIAKRVNTANSPRQTPFYNPATKEFGYESPSNFGPQESQWPRWNGQLQVPKLGVHPLLADLPTPEEAVTQTQTNAEAIANTATQLGTQIHAAANAGLQPDETHDPTILNRLDGRGEWDIRPHVQAAQQLLAQQNQTRTPENPQGAPLESLYPEVDPNQYSAKELPAAEARREQTIAIARTLQQSPNVFNDAARRYVAEADTMREGESPDIEVDQEGAFKRSFGAINAHVLQQEKEQQKPNDQQPSVSVEQPIHAESETEKQGNGNGTEQAGESQKPTPPPAKRKIVELPIDEIHADPARFQYKADTDKNGVSNNLKHINVFNEDLAGVVAVWHDPANGKTYVVNGHHRLELAKRTGQTTMAVRYLKAHDAEEARGTGALINIAEGRGTAIDAAKVFRAGSITPESLESQHGVSLREHIAHDGMALAKLKPSIFDQVVAGDVTIKRGALLGEMLDQHDEQQAALDLLDRAEARGKKLSNEEARELIRFVKGAPRKVVHEQQVSMFGDDEIARSLAIETAEVSSYVKKELGKTQRLFSTTGTAHNANKLNETGNVVNAEENARIAEETKEILAVYDKLSLSAGPIADALHKAAEELAAGTRPATEVKQNALEQVRQAVQTILGRSEPAHDGGSGGASSGRRRVSKTTEGEAGSGGKEGEPDAAGRVNAPESSPPEIGPHGPIFREFSGKPHEAVQKLLAEKTGEVPAALSHRDVGDIDLIWGDEKHGLAKIAKRHPEVLNDLQGILGQMSELKEKRTANSIQLASENHHAVIKRDWKGDPKTWLLTAFEKNKGIAEPSAEKTIDVSGTHATERQAPLPGGPAPSVETKESEAQASTVTPVRLPWQDAALRKMSPTARKIYEAMEAEEKLPNIPVSAQTLRKATGNIEKTSFDKAAMELQKAGLVYGSVSDRSHMDSDEERALLIDTGIDDAMELGSAGVRRRHFVALSRLAEPPNTEFKTEAKTEGDTENKAQTHLLGKAIMSVRDQLATVDRLLPQTNSHSILEDVRKRLQRVLDEGRLDLSDQANAAASAKADMQREIARAEELLRSLAKKHGTPLERFDNPRTGKSQTITLTPDGKYRIEGTPSVYPTLPEARQSARNTLDLSDGVRGKKIPPPPPEPNAPPAVTPPVVRTPDAEFLAGLKSRIGITSEQLDALQKSAEAGPADVLQPRLDRIFEARSLLADGHPIPARRMVESQEDVWANEVLGPLGIGKEDIEKLKVLVAKAGLDPSAMREVRFGLQNAANPASSRGMKLDAVIQAISVLESETPAASTPEETTPEETTPDVRTPPAPSTTPERTPAENEVLRILGRKAMDSMSLPDYFGSSNDFTYDELNNALIRLIQRGTVNRIRMPDGQDGFQRVITRKAVQSSDDVQAPAVTPPAVTPPVETESDETNIYSTTVLGAAKALAARSREFEINATNPDTQGANPAIKEKIKEALKNARQFFERPAFMAKASQAARDELAKQVARAQEILARGRARYPDGRFVPIVGDTVGWTFAGKNLQGVVTAVTPKGLTIEGNGRTTTEVDPEAKNVTIVNGPVAAATPAASERTASPVAAPLSAATPETAGATAMAQAVYEKLKRGEALGNVTELNKLAEKHFGGSRTSGAWTPKDAFDAMEAGINRYLLDQGAALMALDTIDGLKELRQLLSRITTQGTRTDEQMKLQQFSTPPTESYLAAKVAGLRPTDIFMEPSAGNAGLAIWAKAMGLPTMVNEIGKARLATLRWLGFEPTEHDGELINALLETKQRPTVVVMNPPFSAGGLKSHEAKNSNTYGFNHVDSALQRLAPNGRLVVILGGGQANEPEGGASLTGGLSGAWFDKIAKQYNVRANVRINGKEYQKYGTNFFTRLIVIDKDRPTPTEGGRWAHTIQGNVDTLEEAYELLKGVAADRPAVAAATEGTEVPARPGSKTSTGQTESTTGVAASDNSGHPSNGGAVSGSGSNSPGVQLPGGSGQPDRSTPGNQSSTGDQQSGRNESGSEFPSTASPAGSAESSPEVPDVRRPLEQSQGLASPTPSQGLALESDRTAHAEQEDSDAYATYHPTLKGPNHPGDIVETKTMATVPMPTLTYRPDLPPSVLEGGRLSAVQLEAISIAGQQNEIVLPDGSRASALIGDGTGVGKGRISAGILWDNFRRGRKRLVWVSEKFDLQQDATRDFDGIGATDLMKGITVQNGRYVYGPGAAIKGMNKFGPKAKIEHEGVLFTTYSLIRSKSAGARRIDQLEKYLRGDDEGEGAYILFDESHNLKNAVGITPSQQGVLIKELMERNPKLRSVSLSATAATDVTNLGYLDRLGLWGAGTAFPNGFKEFRSQVAEGGMAAMELIARELKALGKYVSRTLSYKGVTYSQEKHELTPEQQEIYRSAAKAWASVFDAADSTIRNTTGNSKEQRGAFASAFYGAQMRFFGVLLTTLKIPTAIALGNKALAEGKSVVITLINTNEAAQNREKNKGKDRDEDEEEEDHDYDFGPKEMLINLLMTHYPVQQYKDDVDQNGKPIKTAVFTKDADGNKIPVNNPQAIAERDALIKRISADLHMPENPLDILVSAFGGRHKVAELTGRKEIYDRDSGKFISRGDPGVKKDDINISEMKNFQDGKKRVAILSSASGTGISLHAANGAKNQQKRYQICLQVGWSADKQMQMFGRTHRTNQVHPPEYVMLVSDLGGEMRFVSTIARRLGSLGALTKGQKNASSGSDLMEKVNFETTQGRQAANAFYTSLLGDAAVPGTSKKGMSILHDLRVLKHDDRTGKLTVPQADLTNVTRLLNRLLALDPDLQNAVYNYYYDIFEAAVQDAIDRGTLDTGVKQLEGDEFSVGQKQVLSADPKTGAQTLYYPVEAKVRMNRMSPEDLAKRLKQKTTNPTLHINPASKSENNLLFSQKANPIVSADGTVTPASYTYRPHNGNKVKATDEEISKSYLPVESWAKQEAVKAEREYNAAVNDLKWRTDDLERATKRERERLAGPAQETVRMLERRIAGFSSYQTPEETAASIARTEPQLTAAKEALQKANTFEFGDDSYQKRTVAQAQEKLAATAKAKEETAAIAADPNEWAQERWSKLYDAAPTHRTIEHHMIAGAVMRFWNPLREATSLSSSIYTANDSKTNVRVVGIDIPKAKIGPLLQRLRSGKSTVDARQLYTDVVRNGTSYTLEKNIQVRRGSIGREKVLQLIPPNADVAETLKDMGVLYERGITPVYYVPNREPGAAGENDPRSTQSILNKILKTYPVRPDEAASAAHAVSNNEPLAAKSLTPFDPQGKYGTQRLVQESDWELQPASGRLPVRMRLNPQGMAVVNALGRLKKGDAGLELDGATAADIASNVRTVAELAELRGMLDAAAVAHAGLLADALNEAARLAGPDGSLILYSGADRAEFARVAREELIHSAQRRYPLTPRNLQRMTSDPLWPLLKRAVVARGYPGLSDDSLLREITAQLMAGHTTLQKYGANAFLRRYHEALTEQYGAEAAREVLQYAEPAIRRTFGYRPEQNSRSSGPEPREKASSRRSGESVPGPSESNEDPDRAKEDGLDLAAADDADDEPLDGPLYSRGGELNIPNVRTLSYLPKSSTAFHLVRANVERVPLADPADARRTIMLASNVNAFELVGRLKGIPVDETAEQGDGLLLDAAESSAIGQWLGEAIKTLAHPGAGLQRLHAAAVEAGQQGKSLALIYSSNDAVPEVVQKAANEELDHAMQEELGPIAEHLGRDGAEELVSSPEGALGRRNLRESFGYKLKNPSVAAAEIIVRLMQQDRYKELGLTTLAQSKRLGDLAVALLERKYGRNERTAEFARRITEAREHSDEEPVGRPGYGDARGNPTGRVDVAKKAPSRPLDVSSVQNDKDRLTAIPAQFRITHATPAEVARMKKEYGATRAGTIAERGKAKPSVYVDDPADPTKELLAREHFKDGYYQTVKVRGLSQLRHAEPAAFLKAMPAANAQAIGQAIMHLAMPAIHMALGKSMTMDHFFRVLQESRLRGRWQYYDAQSDTVLQLTDKELDKNFQNYAELFGKIEDRAGLGRDLKDTLLAIYANQDYPTMRSFVHGVFVDAANAVTHLLTPQEYDDAINTPQFQKALAIYKERVEKPMREAHLEHDGVLTKYPGPLDTYFPLIPVGEKQRGAAAAGYKRPINRYNNFATGLADDYEATIETLEKRLLSGLRASGRAGFLDALKSVGLLQPQENNLNTWEQPVIAWRGVAYYAVRRPTAEAKMIIQGGHMTHAPAQEMLMPKWLADETDPFMDKKFDASIPQATLKEKWKHKDFHVTDIFRILETATAAAVAGVGEPVFHGANLAATIVACTPFLSSSLAGKAASVPFIKMVGAITKLAQTQTTSDEDAAELLEMAQHGMLGTNFASTTYSKTYAELTRSKLNRHSLAPALWGPKGADTRARLLMFRIAKQVWAFQNKQPDDYVGMHLFVNQLGIYTRPLQSKVVRAIKDSPLGRIVGPFVVAGDQMNRNGLNAIAGTGPLPRRGRLARRLALRLALFSMSAVALVAIVAAINKLLTGKWPWDDENARIGDIAIPRTAVEDNPRLLKLYQWKFGNKPVGYTQMYALNPLAMRGLRVVGAKAAADTALAGGEWWQARDAALAEMVNQNMRPVIGPLPATAMVAAFGAEPSIEDIYDDQGNLRPSFFKPAIERNVGGSHAAKRTAAALETLNSSIGGLATGATQEMFPELFGHPKDDDESNRWVRLLSTFLLPSLLSNGVDPAKRRNYLEKQAAAHHRKEERDKAANE